MTAIGRDCDVITRADLLSFYKYFFNADGAPPIPKIHADVIGLGIDVTQNGWAAFDPTKTSVASFNLQGAPGLQTICDVSDDVQLVVAVFVKANYAAAPGFQIIQWQYAAEDGVWSTLGITGTSTTQGPWMGFTGTSFSADVLANKDMGSPLPMTVIPPGWSFRANFNSSAQVGDTATMEYVVLKAPAGAQIPRMAI